MKPQYYLRDTVWLIFQDKVMKTTVTGIRSFDSTPHDYLYALRDTGVYQCSFPESRLFPSKEQLIQSLDYEN
jgi:hypothetical protein